MTEKIICNAEDLVAIADAVRASTGSAVNYNVPELSVAAVDAIGSGGGEDVTAETETYTDLLTDLEAAVDALPDAGSGGSGAETCTVSIQNNEGTIGVAFYTTVDESGNVVYKSDYGLGGGGEITCVCNSVMMLITVDYNLQTTVYNCDNLYSYGDTHVFGVNAVSGGTASITFTGTDESPE